MASQKRTLGLTLLASAAMLFTAAAVIYWSLLPIGGLLPTGSEPQRPFIAAMLAAVAAFDAILGVFHLTRS